MLIMKITRVAQISWATVNQRLTNTQISWTTVGQLFCAARVD